jgi:hypothetical protein
MAEAITFRGLAIVIPTDVVSSTSLEHCYVPFNGTVLTLFNLLQPPRDEGWQPFPEGPNPLWYRHASGAVMPIWNLARTLFDLLTLGEERFVLERDLHGRFIGAFSPRLRAGLLEVPIFNESIAAVVAAADGLAKEGVPRLRFEPDLLRPPVILLSHDVDQLRGNDLWTQMARISRFLRPVLSGRMPDFHHLWYALYNIVRPRHFFFDNILGMIAVERMTGFISSFYFLNGRCGRFGARSGPELIPQAILEIPAGWEVGMHYNYDTHLACDSFFAQRKELKAISKCKISTGRAHYLRFDPLLSWLFLSKMGIEVDESVGYPDFIGYRAGIAGPFHPYDFASCKALPLIEIPLTIMDSTLIQQYPDDPVGAFKRIFEHVGKVGGAVSVLFHPGVFHNPEMPCALNLYQRILFVALNLKAVGRAASYFR